MSTILKITIGIEDGEEPIVTIDEGQKYLRNFNPMDPPKIPVMTGFDIQDRLNASFKEEIIKGLQASIRCSTQELESRREEIRALTTERDELQADNERLFRDIKTAFDERMVAEIRAEKVTKELAGLKSTHGIKLAQAPMTEQQARGMLAHHTQPCACEACDVARRIVAKG